MQRAQHEILRAQKESINDLKKMMTFLLDKQKKKTKSSKTKTSSSKIKDKEKKGENSTSELSDGNENNFGYRNPESSSERTREFRSQR